MILYHAADLLWATRIKAAGDAAGVPCRPVRSVEMLEARLADSPVRGLVVDLDAPEVALELVRRAKSGPEAPPGTPRPAIAVLAFGPHVASDLFAAARAAGADGVMARGAFAARLGEVLARLDGGAAPASPAPPSPTPASDGRE